MLKLTRTVLARTAVVPPLPLTATAQELPEIPADSDTAPRDLVVSSNNDPASPAAAFPLDPAGRQNAHITVTMRDGDVANLYGPEGGQRVHLATANGVFAPEDVADQATGNWFDTSSGALLKRRSLERTRQLEETPGDARACASTTPATDTCAPPGNTSDRHCSECDAGRLSVATSIRGGEPAQMGHSPAQRDVRDGGT